MSGQFIPPPTRPPTIDGNLVHITAYQRQRNGQWQVRAAVESVQTGDAYVSTAWGNVDTDAEYHETIRQACDTLLAWIETHRDKDD
jgi:hypothetical protein